MITLTINGKQHTVDVDSEMPLLWMLRDVVGLTGTKYSCGIAACGACTVHVDGKPIRSCIMPVSRAQNKLITTIEGLAATRFRALQQAWIENDVVQCGFCQSGQLMAAAALLSENTSPNDQDINAAMSGILCRCGTYPRIRHAIKQAAAVLNSAIQKKENA